MAYEAGGRADKLGNYYEKKWLIKQYIRLLCGHIKGVIHEPVQDVSDGIDIQVQPNDGPVEHYQCKGFNGNNEWTIQALGRQHIFEKAVRCLQGSADSTYIFVSADRSSVLRDLCERAKNSSGKLEDFISQLNKSLKESFEFIASTYVEGNQEVTRNLLSRTSFVHQPDDPNYDQDLKNQLSLLVTEQEVAFSLLLTYVETEQKMGCCVTQQELEEYLIRQGCVFKQLQRDSSIPGKIRELNECYSHLFSPIDQYTIREDVLCSMLKKLQAKKNFVILGAAGIGKTGFIRELTQRLSGQQTPYLVIRLDTVPPKANQKSWGMEMGLPDSPAQCLNAIASHQSPVLILDQLDAIRWTSNHNAMATSFLLGTFKEIELLNKENPERPILVVLACRKYDHDNDAAIQQLFAKKETPFERIEIPLLNDQQLERLIGASYTQYPTRLRQLLRYPSNLYFWTKLSSPSFAFLSQRSLINEWWKELMFTFSHKRYIMDTQAKQRKNPNESL